MLFGRLPEKLAPEAERVSLSAGTSARAQRVLASTLCRNPDSRYPDAAALVAALAEARKARTKRRVAPVVLAAASALAIVLLGLAAVAVARLQKADYFWRSPLANARYQ